MTDLLPDEVNVVLTFAEPDGKRWLAAAILGPLVVEGDDTQVMPVADMPDRALRLASFTVVRRD